MCLGCLVARGRLQGVASIAWGAAPVWSAPTQQWTRLQCSLFYSTLQNVWDSRHPRLRRISEGLAEPIQIVSLGLMGNWQTEKDDEIRVEYGCVSCARWAQGAGWRSVSVVEVLGACQAGHHVQPAPAGPAALAASEGPPDSEPPAGRAGRTAGAGWGRRLALRR